jgi:hypothetical protein
VNPEAQRNPPERLSTEPAPNREAGRRPVPLRLSDFPRAAFLIAHGVELVGIEPSADPQRLLFVLQGDPDAVAELQGQYEADGLVPVRRFVAAQDRLRDVLRRFGRWP